MGTFDRCQKLNRAYDQQLMFTSCPACQRQYRISADQLTAAQGLARCGYCGEEFNALQRLTDKPLKLVVRPAPVKVAISPTRDDDDEPQFDIPGILAEEAKPPASRGLRVFCIFLVLLLLVVLVAQLAWFNRDFILQRYPDLQPLAGQLCERLNCQVTRHTSTDGIRLVNRDVRPHPGYADTLLVNATMANESGQVMPFPDIQFALFDTEGKMIAQRHFRPAEYLDGSIDQERGMPVRQPVHFVLEVSGPTRSAVSFEFRFL